VLADGERVSSHDPTLSRGSAQLQASAVEPGLSQHATDHHALRSNEDDEELLIHVPFDGSVKLKAICLIGAAE